MAKQDILNSLEYRRIKDTYHSVLFVDSGGNNLNESPIIYNGDGAIIPFSFSTNTINLSGVNINCNNTLNHVGEHTTRIVTTKINKLYTQKLILSSPTGNNITYQNTFNTNGKNIIPNEIVKSTFINSYAYGAVVFNNISSDFTSPNCTHKDRNDDYKSLKFTISDVDYNNHYVVIIAMVMVVMYETDGNISLQLNDTVIQKKWFRMAVSGDYGGGGRVPITYVYTIPPNSSILNSGENILKVFADKSSMTVYFSDIAILHGTSI